ncbi:MAG: hypothetical protein AAB513_02440 [Patescibacteria group bacterium]|mgnify:CR=1 FL=1
MELEKRILNLEEKIDKIYISVERLRKYFFWTGVLTILLVIIPLLLLPFVLPTALSGLTGAGIEGI